MSVGITLEFEDQVVTDSKLLVIECSHLVRHHSVVTKIVLTYIYIYIASKNVTSY